MLLLSDRNDEDMKGEIWTGIYISFMQIDAFVFMNIGIFFPFAIWNFSIKKIQIRIFHLSKFKNSFPATKASKHKRFGNFINFLMHILRLKKFQLNVDWLPVIQLLLEKTNNRISKKSLKMILLSFSIKFYYWVIGNAFTIRYFCDWIMPEIYVFYIRFQLNLILCGCAWVIARGMKMIK